MASKTPILRGPNEGEELDVLGTKFLSKVSTGETKGTYFMAEAHLTGEGPPKHTHDNEEEGIYVLDGAVDITLGDRTVTAQPGTFCYIPRGTEHTIKANGRESLALLFFTPGEVEGFMRESNGETDEDKVVQSAQKHGITFV